MLAIGFTDVLRRIRVEQEIFQFIVDQIASAGMQSTEIDLQSHLDPADINEIAGEDHLQDRLLVDDLLKHRVEPDLIPAPGGRGDADRQGSVRLKAADACEDASIDLRHPMMCL